MLLRLFVVLFCIHTAVSAGAHGSASGYSCPRVAPAGVAPTDAAYTTKSYVDGAKVFIGGKISDWTGTNKNVTSPIVDTTTGERICVGRMAQMKSSDSLLAVDAAKAAWKSGQGTWPQMRPQQRIEAMEAFVDGILLRRTDIVHSLMWEICKNTADAEAEFDRTVTFIRSTIAAYQQLCSKNAGWDLVAGITAGVRRLAVGIMLCLSPFNYPLNEAYATLIPALLVGNVAIMKVISSILPSPLYQHTLSTRFHPLPLVMTQTLSTNIPTLPLSLTSLCQSTNIIQYTNTNTPSQSSSSLRLSFLPYDCHEMKVPATGGLSHYLTADAFVKALPPGVINFVSGSGRDTMPPIMRSGEGMWIGLTHSLTHALSLTHSSTHQPLYTPHQPLSTLRPVMRSGDVDILAFIGGSKTADALIKEHPSPHRLKLFLQLEGMI